MTVREPGGRRATGGDATAGAKRGRSPAGPDGPPADAREARTRSGPGPRSTSTVPFVSVRYTSAPIPLSRAIVAGAGWP